MALQAQSRRLAASFARWACLFVLVCLGLVSAFAIIPRASNAAGNLTRQTDPQNHATRFEYDALGRRTARILPDDSVERVDYDAHVFDPRDQLQTGAIYDANGNTTTNTAGAQTASYVYDAENRLVKQTGIGADVTIIYDVDGNRVSKTAGGVTTLYLVDNQNPSGYAQVMEERPAATGDPTVTYVYGLALVSQKRGSALKYYGTDGLGSVRYLTDANGTITDTYTHDAFGISIAKTGTTLNDYRYTGQQWDPDLGMYYLRARYYKPDTGRFWTMDSYEGAGGTPLSLHKYLYCLDNPVSHIDPSGHESLVSINFSMALISQFTTHELRGGGAVLRGVREVFGADEDLNSLIYGIDVATIIDEKIGQLALGVTAVLGGVKLVGLASDYLASQGPLRFSQTSAFWKFETEGLFGGKTIGQLADEIRRGIVKASNVPVMFVTRVVDGKKVRLIVNTRSSLALKRAGVPESNWSLIDKTADQTLQKDISKRLADNGLTDEGVDVLRIGTRKGPQEYSVLD